MRKLTGSADFSTSQEYPDVWAGDIVMKLFKNCKTEISMCI